MRPELLVGVGVCFVSGAAETRGAPDQRFVQLSQKPAGHMKVL